MQDGPNADQLPQMLADMCSQITIPIGSSIQRCHGILYKYDIGLAYFVTSGNGKIDLLGSPVISGLASSACVRPATVFFEQISGMQNCKSTVPVMPQQADGISSCHACAWYNAAMHTECHLCK